MSVSSGAQLELKIFKSSWSGLLQDACIFNFGGAGRLFSVFCLWLPSSFLLEFCVCLRVGGLLLFTHVFFSSLLLMKWYTNLLFVQEKKAWNFQVVGQQNKRNPKQMSKIMRWVGHIGDNQTCTDTKHLRYCLYSYYAHICSTDTMCEDYQLLITHFLVRTSGLTRLTWYELHDLPF